VVEMSPEDFDAWVNVARDSSYKKFAETVPGGNELIRKALEAE
jgi:hypothetical protein